jgi:hypothetical protein
MGLTEKYRIGKDISWRQIDDEIIILNLETGDYFSLNETGADILKAIAEAKSLSSLLTEQQQEFDEPAEKLEANIKNLLEDLLDNKIIEKAG